MKKPLFLLILLSVLSSVSHLFGQEVPPQLHPTKIEKAIYFDISPPIRDVHAILTRGKGLPAVNPEVKNKFGFKKHRENQSPDGMLSVDPVIQQQDGTRLPSNVTPLANFEGVSNLSSVYPPDTQGDVGIDKYVQVVNMKFAVYSKTGAILLGPLDLKTIWAGIPAPWNGTNSGDPVVLYDQAADRWLITQFSLPSGIYDQYAETVAVSVTNDPTGSWYRYVFQYGTKLPDYPKFGVWPDAYYMSANQFETSAYNWAGVGVSAFERAKMLTGDPTASMVYFDLGASSNPGSMLPADWDGLVTPLAGEPNHFTYFTDWSGASEYLRIWDFQVDWVTPVNSTFSQVASLTTAAADASFCGWSGNNCIPQPGTTRLLATLSDRLMYRLQYRNFGDHQSMVTNHTLDVNGADHAGVRWYELRNTGSGWSIYQQGTYAPDAAHRWMGSIAMNSIGDIALGYSVSDDVTVPNVYPSIRYTGRKAADPLGTMTMPEQTIINGSGYQSGSASRWGDYSMMSVDPTDDITFWYTTEYIQTSGLKNWQTRIASFKFTEEPAVTTLPASAMLTATATLHGTVNPNSDATNYFFEYGTTASYGQSTPVISAGSGALAVPVSANLTGLLPGYTYHFRLVATNSNGPSYGNDLNFSTPCGFVYGLPFLETFANTTIPSCWSQADYIGNGQVWQFGTITGSSYTGFLPLLTGNYAFLNSDAYLNGNSQNADLVTPVLDLSGYASVTLSFNHYYRSLSGQTGTLSYSVDNGVNWVPIQIFTVSSANPAVFSQAVAAVAGHSQVIFKWNLVANYGWYWAIDDVQVTGLPVNRQLSNLNVPGGANNCYNASQTITTAGSGSFFTVQGGGSTTLIAGYSIDMLPGTKVFPNGYFRGYIAPSGPFCTNPSFMANHGAEVTGNIPEMLAPVNSNQVKIYPNPTSGKFTLELSETDLPGNVRVEIFDIRGEKIESADVAGIKSQEFSIVDRPLGLYFIRVYMGAKAETIKLVKF